MTHDGTPWFTGGGAEHSSAIARILPFIALRGAEGVVNPTDCRCLSMPVATNRIRVMPGPYAILNRALGGDNQMYLGRVTVQDEVATTPTGSGSGRSDLVIIRVENPGPGETWAIPADVKNGPYVFTRIIEGVPGNTTTVKQLNLGYSAIAIARIDLPPSTSTVQQAMITDLRSLATDGGQRIDPVRTDGGTPAPSSGGGVIAPPTGIIKPPIVVADPPMLATDVNAVVKWPASGDFPIPIPAYATKMDYTVNYNNILTVADNWLGSVGLGTTDQLINSPFGQFIAGLIPNVGNLNQRTNQVITGTMDIPPQLRGRTVGFQLNARASVQGNGKIDVDDFSTIDVHYTFRATPTLT